MRSTKGRKALLVLMIAVLASTAIVTLVGCEINSGAIIQPVTPAPGTGNVTGQLLSAGSGGKPYTGGILYLGHVLRADRPDAPPMVSFGSDVSIKAAMRDESSGTFLFTNVSPGEYALVIDQVATSFVVNEVSKSAPLLIVVEAGKTRMLGVVSMP